MLGGKPAPRGLGRDHKGALVPHRSGVTGKHPPRPNLPPSLCLPKMRNGGHAHFLGSL